MANKHKSTKRFPNGRPKKELPIATPIQPQNPQSAGTSTTGSVSTSSVLCAVEVSTTEPVEMPAEPVVEVPAEIPAETPAEVPVKAPAEMAHPPLANRFVENAICLACGGESLGEWKTYQEAPADGVDEQGNAFSHVQFQQRFCPCGQRQTRKVFELRAVVPAEPDYRDARKWWAAVVATHQEFDQGAEPLTTFEELSARDKDDCAKLAIVAKKAFGNLAI